MLFLYFISLFYFTQLTSSQITSESEAINKIIGNILLKAEKKNAETPDFSWNDYFAITEKAKHITRSPKKLIDFNPFMRTQYPRSKPTLKLYDLLPNLRSRQGLKNDERTYESTPKIDILNGNQHSNDELEDDTKTTISESNIKENYGTSATITNFIFKIQRKTRTPVSQPTFPDTFISDGPQDKVFSDSVFTTPQPADVSQDMAFIPHEPTTTSDDYSFDKMQSTPPANLINGIKIFRYGGKTPLLNDIGHYPYSTNTLITPTDLKALNDAEDLISSVPNYDKTSESFDDFLKRVTEPGYKYFDSPDMSFQNTHFYNDIDESPSTTDVTKYTFHNKLLDEFDTVKTITEENTVDDFKSTTPTRYTDKYNPLDMPLWQFHKEKSMKAIFSLNKNNDLKHKGQTKSDVVDWTSKIESNTDETLLPKTTGSEKEQAKLLGTETSHIVDTHSPCTQNTNTPTEETKTTQTNNKLVTNDRKTTTAKIESELAKKKAAQYGKVVQKQEKASEDLTPKTTEETTSENDEVHTSSTTEKVNTIADKTVDVEKETTMEEKESKPTSKKTKIIGSLIKEKESDLAVKNSKIQDALLDEKESKVADKLTQVHEPPFNAKESDKKTKAMNKIVEIAGKDGKKINKANNSGDKKTDINVKIDKNLTDSNSMTTKPDVSDKKSSITDSKKDNSGKKSNLADLYDDILKIYGSLKDTTEKAPQKIQDKISKHLNWESVKRFFGHDRVCNCKCRENKTLCKVCAASDAVMRELTFEFNNLAEYMHTHCTEIQTFFWMNPTGGKRLRDTVHRIDRTMQDYYKRVRGKCTGKKCNTFATYLDRKRYIDKKKNERKYLLELLRDLEISDV